MEMEFARGISGDALVDGLNLRSELERIEIDRTGNGHLVHLVHAVTIINVPLCTTSRVHSVAKCDVGRRTKDGVR